MIYACEDCGFLFNRLGEIKECPYCEKTHIRPATGEETRRLQEFLEQGKQLYNNEDTRDIRSERQRFNCKSLRNM